MPEVNYSTVQGGWSGAGGTAILSADPLFEDADGPDNVVGTLDDNLRLRADSPCAEAADSSPLLDQGIILDLDGNFRFVNFTGKPNSGAGTHPL